MKTIVSPYFRRHQRHIILLIGNSLGPLKRIAFALQHRGHSVLWADGGRSGLRSASLDSPDLVVSEIDLHDLTGFELCRMIKGSFLPKTPVVLIGSTGDKGGDSRYASNAGADATFAELSDTRYILGKLEWLARRGSAGRRQTVEFPASVEASVSYSASDAAGEIRFD